MTLDVAGALGFVIVLAVLAAVVGMAVGILALSPRLTRWMDRDEDAGDGTD